MFRDAHDDSGGGVIRGAIVILLAGVAIGLAYNGLLRASNGDLGLAWIRQEVKLNSLEETLAYKTANGDSLSVGDPVPAVSADSTKEAKPETVLQAKKPEAVEEPAPPASEEVPPVPPVTGTTEAQSTDSLPVIPDSDEPLLVEHATILPLHHAGAAVFVDARSPEEFAAGHIPGAINLPFDLVYEDPTLLDQLDVPGRPVVCYCDGSDCDLAENLAFVLIDAGYRKVLVYEGGTRAWTAAGESLVPGSAE